MQSIRRMALGALVIVAVGSAGCGDEGATDASPTPTTTEPPAADNDAYCEEALTLEQQFAALPDFSPEAIAAVLPQVERVAAAAPETVADEAAILQRGITAAADGDFSNLDAADFTAADATVHAFDVEHCGYAQLDVDLIDYGFEGDLPTAPGLYSYEVTNTGAEFHVFSLARLRDDVDGTAEEAFAAASEETFDDAFDPAGNLGIAPSDSDYQIVDLVPGRYVLFCPIPFGSNATTEFEGDGPPHFTGGMVTYFDVTT